MNRRGDGRRGSLPRVALLGAVTGLRSQVSLALLPARSTPVAWPRPTPGPLRLLDSRPVSPAAPADVGGGVRGRQAAGDPQPDGPGPLGGRVVLGALAGAVLRRGAGASLLPGVLLGALGAGAGAWTGYQARGWLGRTTGLPHPVLGAAEDLVALGLATYALRDGA